MGRRIQRDKGAGHCGIFYFRIVFPNPKKNGEQSR